MNASPLRQRLPCVALLLTASAGILAGRCLDMPGWAFALAAGAFLVASLRGSSALVWLGVGCAFAAVQTWQYRESSAAALSKTLGAEWQVCEARIVVADAPRSVSSGCQFEAVLDELLVAERTLHPGCRVLVRWDGEPPEYGSRFLARASIRNIPPPRNPGELDYAAWLANRGIRSEIHVLRESDATLLGNDGNPIVRFSIAARAWIEHTLTLGISGTNEAALLLGMTIGDTSDLPPQYEDAFRETGTYHVFSVSGLHVGIVAVFLWFVLGVTGLDRRRIIIVLIPCLFFYALVTGWKPASIRAATMLSIVAAGLVFDRWPVALNSLGAAGLVILFASTNQLFNPGFQLSFCVVAAILLLAAPVMNRLDPLLKADPFIPVRLVPPIERAARATARSLAALFAVSFSAWLGSLPLTIAYFHLVSLVAIPANLLIVPLTFVILGIGAISLVSGLFSAWLATVFNNAAFLACRAVLGLATGFAAIPGGSYYVGWPDRPDVVATLTVLDAERGGASLVTAGSHAWLVDTGSEFFAGSTVVPLLRQRGIDSLDGVVLTHGDSGHLGGFDRVRSAVAVRRILDSGLPSRSPVHRRIVAELRSAAIPALAGLRESLGDRAFIEVLFPPPGIDEPLADDKAVVLRIDAGDFSALLLSDAGAFTERWLLRHAADRLPCDVVVLGRHIHGHSGSLDFLAVAKPRALVAAVAPFPPSQRPRPGWLRAIADRGIAIFRQDETGAVLVTVRENEFTLTPFLHDGQKPLTFPNDSLR